METVECLDYLKTDYEEYKKRKATGYTNKKGSKMLKNLKDDEEQNKNSNNMNVIRRITQNLKGIYHLIKRSNKKSFISLKFYKVAFNIKN